MIRIGPAFSDFVSETRRRNKTRNSNASLDWVADLLPLAILLLVFSFLFIRLFYLQVIRGDYYRNLSDNNRIKTKILRAERGIIFDKKGKPLAQNVAAYSSLSSKNTIIFLPQDEALEAIAKGEDKNLTLDVQREYPYKDIFSHVIGYTGQISEEELLSKEFKDYNQSDFVGKMGLEKKYELILRGVDGRQLFERNAKGEIIRELGSEDPIPGQDIKTTLDADLQIAIHDAFKDIEKGAAIVSDPRDGSILALYSKPTFDPNLFTHAQSYKPQGPYKTVEKIIADEMSNPFLNRAISGTYPPGSTYKLITAAAALSTRAISEDTEIEDTGVITIGDFSYGNWYFSQYGRKEGFLDIIAAIKRSNDIFFYRASQNTGIEKLKEMSTTFGLGAKLGIDLPGEEEGLVPDPSWKKNEVGEDWYIGDTFHVGIGQGFLLTTPLQVNMLTSVFANDGVLYKPHLLAQKIEILRYDFVRKEHLELIRSGMKAACEPGGTGYPLFEFKIPFKDSQGSSRGLTPRGKQNSKLKIDNLDYTEVASPSVSLGAGAGASFVQVSLGCKTGTAETTPDQKPHAWITVFAPYYNPEVVVTVLVENGGEGSSVAAPIAKKILEKYFEEK